MRDKEALLATLQAHGQHFLNSFELSSGSTLKRKRDQVEERETKKMRWQGDDDDDDDDDGEEEGEEEGGSVEDENDWEDDDEDQDTFTRKPEIIVFSQGSTSKHSPAKPSFMSSKISKIRQETELGNGGSSKQDGEDEDRTNAENDYLLHKLIRTSLLSNSSSNSKKPSNGTHQKSLQGRILELSNEAKLGKGEQAIREKERNKAPKKVRFGIGDKKKEIAKLELEKAKNMGNYHPTIKKVFAASGSGGGDRGKRERGLRMGIGKFKNGMLKLSREEIGSVQGFGSESSNRGGRGRGRGRGGRGQGRRGT